ncbi:MAG: L-serine ammonia-lyase, iron-sulfur-dependent, subunit alpha, partial [Erysipelotrichaceae bacterium]|nr:L-serine ammonia-lyase, iron-sulfur-dependent, subunit alpha [Erysipelotrichaceae bacterium]
VAGVIGNIVKTNASISGATGGCQAEIGPACAMGAAFASYLEGLDSRKIEYAAEIAMEHHLGLTCDPVGGYVQIPSIERNGVATLRAIDAMNYSKYIGAIKNNKVSFDMVVEVMKYTGKRIPVELRETSLGGLAIELKTDE